MPLVVWAAAALGSLLALAAWLPGMGDVSLPPQGFDDIWHGYLATRLSEMPTITADQVAPVTTGPDGPVTVYPYGLHLAIATAHATTGFSVPTAMNGMWVVCAGLLLPIGSAVLCWRLVPCKPVAAAVAGVSSVLFNVFPFALNGVMPYTLTLCMVPGLLAAVAVRLTDRVSMPVLVIPLVGLGIFVSHPSVAIVAAVLGVLVAAELLLREKSPLGAANGLLLPAALTVLACLPWMARNLGSGAAAVVAAPPGIGGSYSLWGATRLVLTQGSPWTSGQPVLAALVLIGVVTALLRRRAWSIAVGYVCFATLFVGVLAGIQALAQLTGPWYGGWHRLIAVSVSIAPVLVGLGVWGLTDLVRRLADRRNVIIARAVIVVGVVVSLAVSLQGAKYVLRARSTIGTAWQGSQLVTAGDVRLFERLAELTGDQSMVLNNWEDGSTWMYSIAGVRPAIPYESTTSLLPAWKEAQTKASTMASDPATCRLLLDNHVTYALGKRRGTADAGGMLEASLRATPAIFTPVVSTAAGTIFRIRRAALQQCVRGGAPDG